MYISIINSTFQNKSFLSNIYSAIVHLTSAPNVSDMFANEEILVKNRLVRKVDIEEIKEKVLTGSILIMKEAELI